MPLSDQQLVVEPSYPYAEGIAKFLNKNDEDADDNIKVRNKFWSRRYKTTVAVIEQADGKITWGPIGQFNHFTYELNTLGASDAWGMDQEEAAMNLLAEMTKPRQMRHYLLTGMFLETSERSGITYCLRRLKPTLALSGRTGTMRIVCALCLHPIAHYEGSWAGAMAPTDDVIAHLSMLRGDEHLFWRRANQHPAWTHEAGV